MNHQYYNEYTPQELRLGSSKATRKSTIVGLNPLEVLHVKLGHLPEDMIRYIVGTDKRPPLVMGLKYTYKDIKDCHLSMCDACMRGKMKAFPIPSSLSQTSYSPFEYLTVDILPMKVKSSRAHKYCAFFVDKHSSKFMPYFMKRKSEMLKSLIWIIKHYGPHKNNFAVDLKFLLTDYMSEVLSTKFKAFCARKYITLLSSAPYKHSQNLAERHVYTVKDGMRTVMIYNKCPLKYWDYAIQYFSDTHNNLPRKGELLSRNELFNGKKPDVSSAVPFYAKGYYHQTSDERTPRVGGKTHGDRGISCRMMGYCNQPDLQLKNSYTVLAIGGGIKPRHDCYFQHYNDFPSLLNANVNDRDSDTFSDEESPDYDDLFYPDPENVTDLEQQQSTSPTDVLPTDSLLPSEIESNVPISIIPETLTTESKHPKRKRMRFYKDTPPSKLPKAVQSHSSKDRDSMPHPVNNGDDSDDESTPILVRPKSTRKRTPNRNYANQAAPTSSWYQEPLDPKWIEAYNDETRKPPPPKEANAPNGMEQAINSKDGIEWWIGGEREVYRLSKRFTWRLATPSELAKKSKGALTSKWVFKQEFKTNEEYWKYRSRLVVRGFKQRYHYDYTETFSPTASYKSFCIIIHLAAVYDWEIKSLDVENAYLESEIDHDIWMFLPPNKDGFKQLVKLLKGLYGLKQAGLLWYRLLCSKLKDAKLIKLAHDQCVFILRDEATGKVTIVIIYVDDIFLTGNDPEEIERIISLLAVNFLKLTRTDEVRRYVGVDIIRDRSKHKIKLCQPAYAKKYVDKNVPSDMSSKKTPLPLTLDYSGKGDGSLPSIEEHIGSLRFLADRTKPELLTPLGLISGSPAKPTVNQMKGLLHLGRYLKGTINEGVTLGGEDTEINLFGYSDSSFKNTGQNRSGYCFFLNKQSGTIEARSIKETLVAHHSCESEIFAADRCVRQTVWKRGFLNEIGFPQKEPTVIWMDNQAAMILIESYKLGSNVAHLVLRLNYLHQEFLNGTVQFKYVTSENNVADVLTKLLPFPQFLHLKEHLQVGL